MSWLLPMWHWRSRRWEVREMHKTFPWAYFWESIPCATAEWSPHCKGVWYFLGSMLNSANSNLLLHRNHRFCQALSLYFFVLYFSLCSIISWRRSLLKFDKVLDFFFQNSIVCRVFFLNFNALLIFQFSITLCRSHLPLLPLCSDPSFFFSLFSFFFYFLPRISFTFSVHTIWLPPHGTKGKKERTGDEPAKEQQQT